MKIAVLLLAHKNGAQVERLINRLRHPSIRVFLHADQKSALSGYTFSSPAVLVKNTVPVYWGDFSPVQATLNGMKEIRDQTRGFDYFILLSGQDYPIKPIQSLVDFLEKNKGKEFINHYPVNKEGWKAAMSRYQYYHKNVPGWFIFAGFRQLMKLSGIKRKPPVPVWGGSQWFNITRAAFDYILDYTTANPGFTRFMKRCNFTDELFFHTILLNSPFKNNCINDHLRYINWSSDPGKKINSPEVITQKDLTTVRQSPGFFARKFDNSIDENVLDELDRIIGYSS
jgi:hypothetical protein